MRPGRFLSAKRHLATEWKPNVNNNDTAYLRTGCSLQCRNISPQLRANKVFKVLFVKEEI